MPGCADDNLGSGQAIAASRTLTVTFAPIAFHWLFSPVVAAPLKRTNFHGVAGLCDQTPRMGSHQ